MKQKTIIIVELETAAALFLSSRSTRVGILAVTSRQSHVLLCLQKHRPAQKR